MAIISARHKCPACGRTWMMPVNHVLDPDPGTKSPEALECEKQMRDGKEPLPTVCEMCKRRRSFDGQGNENRV